MTSYRDLIVWQKSRQLVKEIYTLTDRFPKTEVFGLTSQMRRAAVSIPANIAEGHMRKHRREYLQFLRIAFGSGAEIETFFTLAKDLSFIKEQEARQAEKLLDEIMRMLNKLITSLAPKP